jgi:hypothetical protein
MNCPTCGYELFDDEERDLLICYSCASTFRQVDVQIEPVDVDFDIFNDPIDPGSPAAEHVASIDDLHRQLFNIADSLANKPSPTTAEINTLLRVIKQLGTAKVGDPETSDLRVWLAALDLDMSDLSKQEIIDIWQAWNAAGQPNHNPPYEPPQPHEYMS